MCTDRNPFGNCLETSKHSNENERDTIEVKSEHDGQNNRRQTKTMKNVYDWISVSVVGVCNFCSI